MLAIAIALATIAQTDIEVIEYTGNDSPRRSWNMIAGGVADELHAELGFSTITAGYQHRLRDGLSIGGLIGFDYAYFAPADVSGAALLLAVPIRWGFVHEPRYGFSLRFAPGLYFGIDQETFSQFIPGLWIDVGVSGAVRLGGGFFIGGGIDVPLIVGFPTGGRDTFVAAPILIGPMAEYQLGRDFALTVDLKIGPHFMTDDFFGTRFATRALLGLAYRM